MVNLICKVIRFNAFELNLNCIVRNLIPVQAAYLTMASVSTPDSGDEHDENGSGSGTDLELTTTASCVTMWQRT